MVVVAVAVAVAVAVVVVVGAEVDFRRSGLGGFARGPRVQESKELAPHESVFVCFGDPCWSDCLVLSLEGPPQSTVLTVAMSRGLGKS